MTTAGISTGRIAGEPETDGRKALGIWPWQACTVADFNFPIHSRTTLLFTALTTSYSRPYYPDVPAKELADTDSVACKIPDFLFSTWTG
jgi:hypothetical protein